ncbi:MAG TPA: trigger factor [Bacteroidales bacterium]|nr:trigger factor [Bacteroidales bacterium]
MKSTLNKINEVNATIVIELEKADYQEKVDKSLNQLRQRAEIPGFRKGKVPKSVIQKMYSKSVLIDEINTIIAEELGNFVKENNLKILGEPLADKNPENQVDLDKDETFKFHFNIGLTPTFDLKLEDVEQTYYNVELEDDMLDKQIDSYKQNFGTYLKVEEEAIETDLIKGTLTEVENGEEKAEGIVVENAILMPSYLKDETIKNSFVGSKVGESIVFNPKTAYDNNEAEVASLLQKTKEEIKDINPDFRFDINEVTRYKEAELDQELFDRVVGEGVVTSEEEFRTKVQEQILKQFKPGADHLFIHEMRDKIVEMMADIEFPEEFLKNWLIESNEGKNEEQIVKDFPLILNDLKFQVFKQKVIEENEIKIEFKDIEALAIEVARAQFAQYGMSNLPDDVLQNYSKSLLEKEETIQNLYEKATEEKVIEWLKKNVNVVDKTVSSEEFNKIMSEHSHEHGENHNHDEHEQHDDIEDQTEEAESSEE